MLKPKKTLSPAVYLLIIGMLAVLLLYFVLYPQALQHVSTKTWGMFDRGN